METNRPSATSQSLARLAFERGIIFAKKLIDKKDFYESDNLLVIFMGVSTGLLFILKNYGDFLKETHIKWLLSLLID